MGRDYLKVGQDYGNPASAWRSPPIAINDGVDSARGTMILPFNIMNEYYARDTSRKIRSLSSPKASPASTSQARLFTAISGTKRDQWLVDPEAAEVVKRIFALDD